MRLLIVWPPTDGVRDVLERAMWTGSHRTAPLTTR